MGMVGGGPGSLIGIVHYRAAVLDGQVRLVCGAFSSDPARSRETGKQYFLPPERVYDSWGEMIDTEKNLPEEDRMELLCVVTPNDLHFAPSMKALESGIHVVCDKPLSFSLQEAREMVHKVEETGLLFALTYPYIAYPMVVEARERVLAGELGTVRKVLVEYPQGWLSDPIEKEGHRQASWRTDPARSGPGGALADIGVHALNLAEYVTGLEVTGVFADLAGVVRGRQLDDDGNFLLRFSNGSRGMMFATQIAAGEENDVNIRVWGEKGGLEWHHHDPSCLLLKINGKPLNILRAGHPEYLSGAAMDHSRLPGGHPEGFIEAFANIYRNVAGCIGKIREGRSLSSRDKNFPDIYQGLRGMLFQDAAVRSSREGKWITLESR